MKFSPSPQKIPHPHVNFPIPIPPLNLKSEPIYHPRHVMKTYSVNCRNCLWCSQIKNVWTIFNVFTQLRTRTTTPRLQTTELHHEAQVTQTWPLMGVFTPSVCRSLDMIGGGRRTSDWSQFRCAKWVTLITWRVINQCPSQQSVIVCRTLS